MTDWWLGKGARQHGAIPRMADRIERGALDKVLLNGFREFNDVRTGRGDGRNGVRLEHTLQHFWPAAIKARNCITKHECVTLCVETYTLATNLAIDPKLIEQALAVSNERTKKAAVTQALLEFLHRQTATEAAARPHGRASNGMKRSTINWAVRESEPVCRHQRLVTCLAPRRISSGASGRDADSRD